MRAENSYSALVFHGCITISHYATPIFLRGCIFFNCSSEHNTNLIMPLPYHSYGFQQVFCAVYRKQRTSYYHALHLKAIEVMTLQYSTCSFQQQDTLIAVLQYMSTIFFSIAGRIITFNGNIPNIKVNSQEKQKASLPHWYSILPQIPLPHTGALNSCFLTKHSFGRWFERTLQFNLKGKLKFCQDWETKNPGHTSNKAHYKTKHVERWIKQPWFFLYSMTTKNFKFEMRSVHL